MRISLELCDTCYPWPQCSRFRVPHFKPLPLALAPKQSSSGPSAQEAQICKPPGAPQATQALQRGTYLFPALTAGGESDRTHQVGA